MFFTVDLSQCGFFRLQPFPSNIVIVDRLLDMAAKSTTFNCSFNNGPSNEYGLKIINKLVNKEVSIY